MQHRPRAAARRHAGLEVVDPQGHPDPFHKHQRPIVAGQPREQILPWAPDHREHAGIGKRQHERVQVHTTPPKDSMATGRVTQSTCPAPSRLHPPNRPQLPRHQPRMHVPPHRGITARKAVFHPQASPERLDLLGRHLRLRQLCGGPATLRSPPPRDRRPKAVPSAGPRLPGPPVPAAPAGCFWPPPTAGRSHAHFVPCS